MSLVAYIERLVVSIVSTPDGTFQRMLTRTVTAQRVWYANAVIAFAIAATLMTVGLRLEHVRSSRMQGEAHTLLAAPYEPGSTSADTDGLNQVVLAPINITGRRAPHPNVSALLRVVQAAASRAPEFGGCRVTQSRSESTEEFLGHFQRCLPTEPESPGESHRTNQWTWGLPYCRRPATIRYGSAIASLAPDHASMMVAGTTPRTSAAGVDASAAENGFLARERDVLCASSVLALDDSLHHVMNSFSVSVLEPRPDSFGGRIVQVYFVGQGGVFSEWDVGSHDAEVMLSRPLAHPEAASYARRFWAEDHGRADVQSSYVYVDIGGYGLVQTHCAAVFSSPQLARTPPRRDESRVDPDGAAYLGAACVDQTVDVRAFDHLVTRRQDQDERLLYEGELYSVWRIGHDDLRAMQRTSNAPCEALSAVGEWLHSGDGRRALNLESPRSFAEAVPVNGGLLGQLLPLNRDASGRYDWLYVSPSRPGSVPNSFWFGAAFLFVAIVSLAVGASGASRVNQESTRAAILRGLPVPVVTVDVEGTILRANDRAEEILDVALPRFGASDERDVEPKQLKNLLDGRIVVRGHWWNRTSTSPTTIDFGWIRTQLLSGLGLRYFASVNRGGSATSVRIDSIPISLDTRDGDRSDPDRTFAIVTLVPTETSSTDEGTQT